MGRVIFRKIGKRIIPIRVPDAAKDLAAGGAAFLGATAVAHKVRKKTSESIRGKGKKSLGGLSNAVFEIGFSAAALTILAKKGPGRLKTGIPAFGRVITGSFGLARKQARGF